MQYFVAAVCALACGASTAYVVYGEVRNSYRVRDASVLSVLTVLVNLLWVHLLTFLHVRMIVAALAVSAVTFLVQVLILRLVKP